MNVWTLSVGDGCSAERDERAARDGRRCTGAVPPTGDRAGPGVRLVTLARAGRG